MTGRWRRRVALASLAIAVLAPIALFLLAHTAFVRSMVTAWAIERLKAQFGVDLTVQRVEYNLASLSVRLNNVAASAPRHSELPFFRARDIWIDIPWRMVWRRGDDIHVESLRLIESRVSIQRFRDGTLNLPAPRTTPVATAPVFRFGTLVVNGLDVSYVDEGRDVRLDTQGISFSLTRGETESIEGPLTVGAGPALIFGSDIDQRAIRSSRFAGTIGFDGRGLDFHTLEIAIPQARLTLDGRIDRLFAAPTIDTRLTGRADLGRLAALALPHTSLADDLHGNANVKGRLTGEIVSPIADLVVDGRSIRWRAIAATAMEANVRVTTSEAAFDQVRVRIGDSTLEARGRWPFGIDAPRILSARWRRLDPDLIRQVVPQFPEQVAASFDGQVELVADRLELAAVRATMRNRASPSPNRRGAPIDGSLTLQLDRGAWRLQQAHRIGSDLDIESDLRGRLASRITDSTVTGTATAHVSDPAAAVEALRTGGLAVPDVLEDVGGDIRGTFDLSGRLQRPQVSGRIHSENLSVRKVGPLRATATFSGDTRAATVDRLDLRLGDNSLVATGTTDFSTGALRGRFEASLNDLPAVANAAGVSEWNPSGSLASTGAFGGTLKTPSLIADVDGRLSLAGNDLDRVSGHVELENNQARIRAGAPLFGATADAVVVVSRPYEYSARAWAARLDLSALPVDWIRTRKIGGFITLSGGASGTLERLAEVRGSLEVLPADLTIGDRSVRLTEPVRVEYSEGAITVSEVQVLSPDTGVVVRLRNGAARLPPSRAERASASLAEAFGGGGRSDEARLKPGTTSQRPGTAIADLNVDLRVENITPKLLEGVLPDTARSSIAGAANITAHIQAETLDLQDVKGDIDIETDRWSIQGVAFEPLRPPRFTLGAGRLRVESFEWRMVERPENRLALAGGVDLVSNQLDARITGQTDLRLLGAIVPDVNTFGDATLDLALTGASNAPDPHGHIAIQRAGFTLRDPAIAVTDLQGTLQVSRTGITTGDLKGRANGGAVSARGTFDYRVLTSRKAAGPAGRPGPAQVSAASLTIEGRNIGLDAPAGLESEVDVDLTIRAEDLTPRISGRVTLLRGEYRRPLSVVTQLLGSSTALSPGAPHLELSQLSAAGRMADRLALDVRIVTDADIEVDNNYGRFDLGADLRVLGSVARPGVVGRAELREGGQLFLGGTTYVIDRGSIDFANPVAIVPDLSISARTTVGGHEITLGISGTPDRLTTDLSADDPTLSKADIVSLLLTGRPYSDLASQQASASGQQLLGLLSGEVLGVAGRAVGLDTLRFERGVTADLGDLSDVAGETDPTARLTLAKNLSPEVRLLLSQNLKLGGITWLASYQPRPNVDLRFISREDRDRTYEARHQISVGGPKTTMARRASAAQPRIQAVRIAGDPGFAESDLIAGLQQVAGRRFDFRKWREDRDRLERWYEEAGYLEATTSARRLPADAEVVTLEYDITRGPRTEIIVTGGRLSDRALEAIRSAWRHAVFDRFLEEEAMRLARVDLVREGYLQARVKATISLSDEIPAIKRLVVSIEPGERRTERRIQFEGNRFFSTRELETLVTTHDYELEAWLDPMSLRQWLTDLYRSAGFLAARIHGASIEFPAAGRAILRVTIEEGPKYRVGDIRWNGVAPARIEPLREAVGLTTGDEYAPRLLADARRRIEQWYRGRGFNEGVVEPSQTIDPAHTRVDITFNVLEGPEQRLLRVEVGGAVQTSPAIVERTLHLEVDRPVDMDEWQRGRKRLYDTGIFQSVDIEPVASSAPIETPGAFVQPIVARVTLVERPRWRFRYGVQLNDEARSASEARDLSTGLVAEILDRNLFGRAASAGATYRYDRDRNLARGFLSTPRVFGLPATTSLFVTRSREERGTAIPIVIDRSSLSGEQRVNPFGRLNVTYGYSLEQNHTFSRGVDPDDPLGIDVTVRTARLTGTAVIDTRDDPFQTRQGSFHSSSVEYAASRLGSDLRFIKYLAQQTYFRPVHQLVLASSARLGVGRGFGQDLIPSEQFLAGGANTVRGYEDDALGGLDFLGEPVGGNAMIVLNQEFRFPVYKWVGGVGFVDAGNVFPSARDLDLLNLKVGVGAGVRVSTPFALVRVDFGLPLSERATGGRRGRWYFSIGQIF
ncbi:MAG: translocation/assembly module TamB domain-containing protein [Acidobacteria bacterium]|nr:translocation/assembly module TamB domain-containing protein [Acidobacteriota bacterium]